MNKVRLLILLFLVIHIVEPLPSISSHPAIDVVEKLHKTLLTIMKEGNKIGYKGRYDQLAPVITACFDLPFIAKTVSGRYWEIFNNEQKSKFVDTFSKLSIATYAYHFDDYSGERFNFILEKDLSDGQILIQTQIIKSDGGKVRLDYVLHRNENQWRIINIITDGVSDLALKRADYTSFLKTKGFDDMIGKLNDKIAQYSK
jgi:phospholipid transport system substrate-binding protein